MGNNLGVNVSADIVDLQTKMVVAKAEVSGLTKEMNNLAKQSAAGILDPAGLGQLQQISGELVRARTEAAALTSEFKKMQGETKSSFEGVGASVEEVGSKLTAAFQFTGAAVAVEAISKVGEAVEQMGARATQMQTMASVLQVSTDQMQAMQAAANEAGVGVEVLTRAGERLNTMLFDARNSSGAAVEKLRDLGLTMAEIQNPAFKINDLLGSLHDRLIDSSTHQQTMNELVKEFGARAALAAAAIEKYDGSTKGVADTMARLNGLTDAQIQRAHETGVTWEEAETKAGNFGTKAFQWMQNVGVAIERNVSSVRRLSEAIGAPLPEQKIPAQQVGVIDRGAAQASANQLIDIQNEIEKQEVANAQAGVAAYKEATQQKLDQLRNLESATVQYYGADSKEAAKAAEQIVAEQRKVAEAAIASHLKASEQYNSAMEREVSLKLAAIGKEVSADDTYLTQFETNMKELSDFAQSLDTEVTNRHAELLKQKAALDAQSAKQSETIWKGMVGEIESAESSMVSNLLTKRKSLSQSLIQLSGQLITSEIANDLKAFTTKELLQDKDKALQQGGLLYHAAIELQKMMATARSQSAQTGATVAGNTARLTSTESAAAVGAATSSAIGGKTVMQDAAKAFSGTYASVSQIPYVGWIMAPIAASAAYAGVAAYEGMASLDTGTNYVPRDMMAQIHEGEAVVPRQYNPAAGGSGGGFSETHNYTGDTHISAFDSGSVARALSRPGYRNSVVSSAMRSFRRGAR